MSAPSELSVFQALFQAACKEYESRTRTTLIEHPLAIQLQTCHSFESLIALLQEQARAFNEFRASDGKGIVDGGASLDVLVDLFESITNFLHRLDIYIKIPPTAAMTEIVVKIIVELLSTLALVAKHTRQGRLEKIGKNLLEESEVEAMLRRLDRLTQNEARTATAQTLEVVYRLLQNMSVLMEDCKAYTDNSKRDQLQRDIQNWLSPPDPWENQGIASKAHQMGTAEWFIQGDTFAEWKSSGSLLWVHGKPGSGKTILCSTVIEDLDRLRKAGLASLAFFYFDTNSRDSISRKKDLRSLLSSLIYQLYDQSDSYYNILSDFYSAHHRGSQYPSDVALTQCLKDMLNCPGQAPIYIVVDGIDECLKSSGRLYPHEEVLALVEELVGLHLPNLHICIASRPDVDIKAVIHPLTSHSISLHNDEGQMQDIVDYITSVVNSDPGMRRWRVEDRELVIDMLSHKADGMFGWAACQLDVLRSCLPLHIRRALEEFPATLDWTYERALQDIPDIKWGCAHILLQCILVSSRPLLVKELAEFLAFDFNAGPLPQFQPDCRLEDPEDALLSTCPGLLTVVEVNGSRIVQFSHFSVKQFLVSGRRAKPTWPGDRSSRFHVDMTHAHTIVAKACLSVLLSLESKASRDSIRDFPLADYAARHWADHAQINGVSQHIKNAMNLLFDPHKLHFAVWTSLYNPDEYLPPHPRSKSSRQARGTRLHYAAMYGFGGVVDFLAGMSREDINTIGTSHEQTPLGMACEVGQIETARSLLSHGAHANARDGSNRTPLHWASQEGRLNVAQLLLDYSADANVGDGNNRTPLHLASQEGRLELAKLLLDRCADANARDASNRTPLHWASQEGHLKVAELLLDRRADAKARDGSNRTPLHWASQEGRLEVAEFLLGRSRDADARDGSDRTPLHWASQEGHLDVAQLLLGRGADQNAWDESGQTPLHLACRGGHRDLVQYLLTRDGLTIDAQNNKGRTPFQEASAGGRRDIMELLLPQQDNPDSEQLHGRSPAGPAGETILLETVAESGT